MVENIQITKTYTEADILRFAEFLVKYQLEYDGSPKLLATAINEAKERIPCEDFTVRAANSVDGKEHVFTFNK